MKKYMLFRLGAKPEKKASEALGKHIIQNSEYAFMAMPPFLVTIFTSNSDIKEIKQDLKEAESKPEYSFWIFDVTNDKKGETWEINLPSLVEEKLHNVINSDVINTTTAQKTTRRNSNLKDYTLDMMLDLVLLKGGVDNLTKEEKKHLDKLSKNS